jgi:PKD domain
MGWTSYNGLAGIVQEIVNQPGWAAGNSLSLIIEGRGGDWSRKFFTAWEADAALAPQLVIAWYLPEPTLLPPTLEPTVESTTEPTTEPTAEMTATATPEPTIEPTLEPTPAPTAEPSATPTDVLPTSTPTPEPTLVPLPTVTISADVLAGLAPLTVQFSSLVTDATEYAWDFGDASGVSLEASPIYTFSTPGTYTVTLIVIGQGGMASATLTVTVQ